MNWGVTAALAIITFIGAWNAFLWPFLAVTKEPMMNVAVGVGSNFTALGVGYLAASLLAGIAGRDRLPDLPAPGDPGDRALRRRVKG